jgi:Na+/H+ antiporter NhaD/arsenite permease-like protein
MSISLLIIILFIIGYTFIVLEHPLVMDKTAPALLTGVITWAVYIIAAGQFGVSFEGLDHTLAELTQMFGHEVTPLEGVEHQFMHHLSEIASILFFLMGAMTIVELIDMHDGFQVIISKINTTNKRKLLWILCILTFFLSAVLDNLTTSIVMISLIRKILKHKTHRLLFAGMVVIAANAGGAWSPIGDITTTMLWIGGQISAGKTVIALIIPSLICLLVPLVVISRKLKGDFYRPKVYVNYKTTLFERTLILALGVGGLLFVPLFKTVTHLPPFMGMFFAVGILWATTEIIHKRKTLDEKSRYSVYTALSRIDAPSMLFFFGILAAITCLESIGKLAQLAVLLDTYIGNEDIIVIAIGLLSAIVDNVPLVAASMGMYDIGTFPMDDKLWQFIAYCAGTGGSILIIGSAAGVAIMGIQKIDFIWYLRKIGPLAFIGYIAGALAYLGMYKLYMG